jgi:2''-5'' RNA ligase
MTGSLRLFFALWPDEITRKALSKWQSTIPGRKTPPENLHITLAFLGEQPASSVPELSRILEHVSSDAISLKLDRMGYFSKSRISWAGMKAIPPDLTQLYKELVAILAEKSISFDRKNRFKPHITLARHSSRTETADLNPIIWHANHLVLVKSCFRQDEKGSHPQYIPVAERRLGN